MPPKDRDASVDALRKAERKKEKAKNKRDRARTREEALAVRDPAPIRAQLARLLPQLAAGALDGAGKKQVELLQKQLRVCLEKRKEAETAQQARQVSARAVTLEGFGEAFGGGADDDDDDDDDGGGGGGGGGEGDSDDDDDDDEDDEDDDDDNEGGARSSFIVIAGEAEEYHQ